MFNADDGSKSFTDIFAGKSVALEQVSLLRIAVNTTGERCSQSRHVSPTIFVTDDVRIAKNRFTESIRPLQCKFYRDHALLDFFLALNDDDVVVHCFFSLIELADEFCQSTFVKVFDNMRFFSPFVMNYDLKACVEE